MLNHWRINEEVFLLNINTIKCTITTRFKDKLRCKEEIENKIKLMYYENIINPKLEDYNSFYSVDNVKRKIKFAKIRTYLHELGARST